MSSNFHPAELIFPAGMLIGIALLVTGGIVRHKEKDHKMKSNISPWIFFGIGIGVLLISLPFATAGLQK